MQPYLTSILEIADQVIIKRGAKRGELLVKMEPGIAVAAPEGLGRLLTKLKLKKRQGDGRVLRLRESPIECLPRS
jgi:hypothetical protein